MSELMYAPERPQTPERRAWRSLTEPARWTVALLVGCAVWAVYTAGTSVFGIVAIDRDPFGDEGWLDVSNALDTSSGIFGAVVGLPAIVLFLVWFARAHHDLRLRGADVRSPAWACWSWFVPVANLWVPYLATRDLWRAGDSARRTGLLLPVWWAMWLGGFALGMAAAIVRPIESDDLDRYRTAYLLDLPAEALSLAGALLLIAIVRRVTARIEALRRG